jgi:hypothetical protein
VKNRFSDKGGASRGDCVRAGAGVSIRDDADEEVGDRTSAVPFSSVVDGNDEESGDDAVGRL